MSAYGTGAGCGRPARLTLAWIAFAAIAGSCGPSHPTASPTARHPLTRTTVAVADFEGGSVPPSEDAAFWQRALALNVIADLRASDAVRIVERTRLADILREQRLATSALSDPTTQLQVGKIVGAQMFVFGTYTIIGGSAVLTVRMTDVETGRVVESEKITGRADAMGTLAKQLSVLLLRNLDTALAAREVERLQAAGDGPPLEAVKCFSQGLDLEDRKQFDEAVAKYTQALTIWPRYEDAREHLERASEAAARR